MKLPDAIEWRWRECRRWGLEQMRRLPPRLSMSLRWPLQKPWQRPALRLTSHGGGIGDELMCLAVFREIKRRNPACRITFVTRHEEIFRGAANVDAIEPHTAAAAVGAIELGYVPPVPPRRPLVTLMAECVGLEMGPEVAELPPVEPSNPLREAVAAIPRPRVVIQPLASRWTPVKNWPLPFWRELIPMLLQHATVIEVGTEPAFADQDFGPAFVSFAGKTSRPDFLWLIGQGDVFVGPSSGGMHVAAAQGVRSVIIFGGYEQPDGYQYPNTTPFYRAVECAPCWRTDECPYDLKCMRQITPDEVFAAVRTALAG